MLRAVLAGAVLALPAALPAQALHCKIPPGLSRPHQDGPTGNQPRWVVPIGGYTLALTWAPQDCAANGRQADRRLQCGGGNRFGFTLQGCGRMAPGRSGRNIAGGRRCCRRR
ncbi:hypothetical protein [Sphingomonas flavalba]|uniref:hypothetical protein n=1 Tax=Sphingomonas flavalba TaxID=2559804 RepID=UPI0030846140